MSDEQMPPVNGEINDSEITETDTRDIARMHSSETPESALITQEEHGVSSLESGDATTNEPPESIVNVSEVVGIGEEQVEEINALGDMSRELSRANNVLQRIDNLSPEEIRPHEASVDQRKAYIENFIAETRKLKDEATKESVALLRDLPDAKEIDSLVSLDDEATISELVLHKKDKNQPLSKDEELALSQAFESRDRYFKKLKTLGIQRDAARVIYQRMLAEKTAELRSHIPQSVTHDRKIDMATELFVAANPAITGPLQPKDVITPFLTPKVLAAIEELNNQPTEEEIREREALNNVANVEEILQHAPASEFVHETPDEEMFVVPEMIDALRRDKIYVKEGAKLTALQAVLLRRDVLGARGTVYIERQQERARAYAEQAAKSTSLSASTEMPEESVPAIPTLQDVVESTPVSTEGISVQELDVEEITIPPVASGSRTPEMRREKGRELLGDHPAATVRTEEVRRAKGRELLDWKDDAAEGRDFTDYAAQWEKTSEEEKQKILAESRFLFNSGKNYRIRRSSGAIEEWTLFSILDNGDARMFSPDGQSHKDVPLLELRNLNIITETPDQIIGHEEEKEMMNTEMLSLAQLTEQIAILEAQRSRTEEEEKKLKGLIWLRDNAKANGVSNEEGRVDAALKGIETLLPKAILSEESKSEIARVSKLVLPGDALLLARPKEDVLANGTKEEQDAYRAAEDRWESFMNALEGMGIDPDVAEKIYEKVVGSEVRSIDERVIGEYSERFGINKEVLEGISGFTELTPGQQLLVLENFKKTAAQDVSVEALKMYKEDLARSGFWGRAWKNMTKQYQLGKAKGLIAEEWREGGSREALAMKRDTLEGLTKLALTQKEFDVAEKDGALEIQFANKEQFAGAELSIEEMGILERFNDVANRYANLDYTGLEGNKEDFREMIEREYQTALEAVTGVYATHDPLGGMSWQHKVRSAVQMNRFFADNPELEKDLNRSAGMSAFLSAKNTLVERGTIAGVGVGLRVAAVSALGTAGLFVAAPFVGGYLGAKRAKQSIMEKDLLARMGEHDESDEARHEQTMDSNEKDVAKNIIDADLLRRKLSQSLDEIGQVNEMQTIEIAKRDALGNLVRDEKGNVVKETVSKKEQLLSSLDARIEYTKRKLEEELVNLGGTNSIRIAAINDLMEALGHAEARVALEDPVNSNALTERLDNLLDIRKEKIEDNRKYLVRKEAAKGATLALGFAVAGTGIGWAVRHGIDAGWFGGTPKGATLPPEAVPGAKPPQGAIEHAPSPAEQVATPPAAKMAEALGSEEYVRNFNDNISHIIGANTSRAPLSIEELDALRRTAGLEGPVGINAEAHNALIYEMRKSPVALSNDTIQKILTHYKDYIDPSSVNPHGAEDFIENPSGAAVTSGVVAHAFEATPKMYSVGSGDTLTSILKQHVSEVRALSSDGQENAVQNLLRALSSEDLKQIGVTDPNKLSVGQSLNLEKIVQLLYEKQVGGTDILKHAEILTTPKSGILEDATTHAQVAHLEESVADTSAAPLAHDVSSAHVPAEAVATPSAPAAALHEHTTAEVAGSGRGASGHVAAEVRSNWHDIPEALRLPQATAEAQRYLEDDISKLYGPPSKFGYWPREWTSLSARNAAMVIAQTKETNSLGGVENVSPGYQWSVVNKIQQYLREQGFTKENGFAPQEKESIAEFIKRAHAAKIMNDGPTRPPQGQ